jgi:hypothetical protein
MPPAILSAYQQSLLSQQVYGRSRKCVNFAKLESQLIELRRGDPHADMLVVNTPLAGIAWAHGMATFTSGVGVFEEDNVSFHLGKHETGYLLGYLYHDSYPLYVLGYPWEGTPWGRDNLMMLYGVNCELSPRWRDALRYFWRGLERRSGKKYLRD